MDQPDIFSLSAIGQAPRERRVADLRSPATERISILETLVRQFLIGKYVVAYPHCHLAIGSITCALT